MVGKIPSTNVTIIGTDKVQIVFRSTGEQDLKVGEGVPVVSSGSKVNQNAQAHGTVPGTSILFHSPA
jgi:hypothetical protein